MRTSLLFGVAVITSAIMPGMNTPVGGSLVTAVPTKSGWVVCADKRSTDRIQGRVDTNVKLFEIAPGVIFGAAGFFAFHKTIIDGRTGKEALGPLSFGVNQQTVKYFTGRSLRNSVEGWSDYIVFVLKGLRSYLDSVPASSWPEGDVVFTVGFFWLEPSGAPSHQMIVFSYDDRFPKPNIKAQTDRTGSPDPHASSNAYSLGNVVVHQEIVGGKDRRFDDLRRDKEFRRFLFDSPPRSTVTDASAERFARRLIRVSSERRLLLESSLSGDISPTSDCAIITAQGVKFKWALGLTVLPK